MCKWRAAVVVRQWEDARPPGNFPCKRMVFVVVNSKKIGFLSFGHYGRSAGSHTQDAGESLRQAIELSVAAEELTEQPPVFVLEPFFRNALELEEQLIPTHFALANCSQSRGMRYRQGDKPLDAVRMQRRRHPGDGRTPM